MPRLPRQPNDRSVAARRGTIAGSMGIAVVVAIGVAIRVFIDNQPTALDQWLHDLLAAHRTTVADTLAQVLNVVGGTAVMTLITVAAVVLLALRQRWQEGLVVGATVAAASAADTLLKLALARPRPADATIDVTGYSFPSGHVTTAAAMSVAVAIIFPRLWTWVIASVWIAGMAASRMYLLVHWMTDAVAGAALGASVAVLVWAIFAATWQKQSAPRLGK